MLEDSGRGRAVRRAMRGVTGGLQQYHRQVDLFALVIDDDDALGSCRLHDAVVGRHRRLGEVLKDLLDVLMPPGNLLARVVHAGEVGDLSEAAARRRGRDN